MGKFEDLLQNIVNMSKEEKIDMAVSAINNLMPSFKQIDDKTNGFAIFSSLIGSAVGADGEISEDEFYFLQSFLKAYDLELSKEEFIDYLKSSTSENSYKLVLELKEILTDDGILEVTKLIAAICAIDDKIDKNEAAYIATLLS